MGKPEVIPGLFERMDKYGLSVNMIRIYIQSYWDSGGNDFNELMELLPIAFDNDDLNWARRVFDGQWSAMRYEIMQECFVILFYFQTFKSIINNFKSYFGECRC